MTFNRMTYAAEPMFKRICAHPFNQELCHGSLAKDIFYRYLEQDTLYLKQFAQVLDIIARRMQDENHIRQFNQFIEETVQCEQVIHQAYLSQRQASKFFYSKENQLAPLLSTSSYIATLYHHAKEAPLAVAVASVAPCFYYYGELGKWMKPSLHDLHPYRAWVNGYASEPYLASVAAVIKILEELSIDLPDEIEEKMIATFVESTEHEHNFWDGVYHFKEEELLTEPSKKLLQ